MTITADGGAEISLRNRLCVNTLSISEKRSVADPAAFHHRFVAVASAAGGGDVCAIHGRLGISRRQDRTHVAIGGVAIKTSRSATAVANRLRMKAVVVICMRPCVK